MAILSSDDPRPAYIQVADDLRDQVRSGKLNPGDRLPTGRELSEHYGIASMPVRQALKLLSNEGVVITRQGRGAFVRADGDANAQPPSDDEVLHELRAIRSELTELRHRVEELEGGQ